MFILKKDRPNNSLEEWDIAWSRYQRYLSDISRDLPPAALGFATAEWHYNHLDHRAPHDSWVKHIEIRPAFDVSEQSSHIRATLLGAYHDGDIEIFYSRVRSNTLVSSNMGYGDWLYDEIRLSNSGQVLHEVEFENGHWLIECEDLAYRWLPLHASEE